MTITKVDYKDLGPVIEELMTLDAKHNGEIIPIYDTHIHEWSSEIITRKLGGEIQVVLTLKRKRSDTK